MLSNREYLPDFIFGAIDGLVTTFAVVSGVVGASLSPSIILILGFANLFADGFSMAASNYLHSKSEKELEQMRAEKQHHKSAYITFVSFVGIGLIPLLPFIFNFGENSFVMSAVLTVTAFFCVGYINGIVTSKNRIKSALQTLFIGAAAATVAYVIGRLLSQIKH